MDNTQGQKKSEIKWYFRPFWVIIIILSVGPLALPLVWLSPAFKKSQKVLITVVLVLLMVWLIRTSVELYDIFLRHMEELQKVLNP